MILYLVLLFSVNIINVEISVFFRVYNCKGTYEGYSESDRSELRIMRSIGGTVCFQQVTGQYFN